jgi:hypothetical protein
VFDIRYSLFLSDARDGPEVPEEPGTLGQHHGEKCSKK